MAAGRPVIAYAGGGALETVVEGVTGTFFDQRTSASLAEAVRRFEASAYDPAAIRAHAQKFDVSVFKAGMRAAIENELGGEWN